MEVKGESGTEGSLEYDKTESGRGGWTQATVSIHRLPPSNSWTTSRRKERSKE